MGAIFTLVRRWLARRSAEGTNHTQTFLLKRRSLELARQRLSDGDERVSAAASAVRAAADACLKRPLYRVTEKSTLPPSGNPRDYYSIGTYWWPNPDTEDGLPWVRRDGMVNPDSMASDTGKVRRLCREARILALAWWLFGDERYAVHCARLLRAWFVDQDTAMTPHLRYAQCIPGVSEGRRHGIIDTRGFRYLGDCATLILDQGEWSDEDHSTMRDWMASFLDWLRTSPAGKGENRAQNNHGTWYSAQALGIALFCGKTKLASQLARIAAKRIDAQIQSDGRQPEELKRSRPLTYCTMNLWAFFEVATLAEAVDVDLWEYRAVNGACLENAARWLLPYVRQESDWPEREVVEYKPENYLSVFRRAALSYDPAFEPEQLPLDQKTVRKDQVQIIYPSVEQAKR